MVEMVIVGQWYDPDTNEWFVVAKMNEQQFKEWEKEKNEIPTY